jgi:hypothetical protein
MEGQSFNEPFRADASTLKHLAVDNHRGVELAVDAGERVAGGEDRHADRGGLSLEVRTAGERPIKPGTPTALGIDPQRVSLFSADGGARL